MTTIQYKFNIPPYADKMLCWNIGETAKSEGELLLPELPHELRLCWGTAHSTPLRIWQAPYETPLTWNSELIVHGHLDAIHVTATEWLIFDLTGRLLPPNWQMQPSLNDLKTTPYSSRLAVEVEEEQFWYSFITPLDSPFVDLIHHALVNGHAVECYGALAGQKSNLQAVLGMPLVLNGMTLHASR